MHTVYKLPGTNGAGSKLTVTSTAQGIQDLIRTASSDSTWVLDSSINAIDLSVETEGIRWFDDGNTPTASLGNPLGIDGKERLRGVAINSVITLYDNTAASGTIIWSSGTMGSQTQPFELDFKSLQFSTGLTLLISGANSNITVIYE